LNRVGFLRAFASTWYGSNDTSTSSSLINEGQMAVVCNHNNLHLTLLGWYKLEPIYAHFTPNGVWRHWHRMSTTLCCWELCVCFMAVESCLQQVSVQIFIHVVPVNACINQVPQRLISTPLRSQSSWSCLNRFPESPRVPLSKVFN
jgi:hypothetical protein